MGKQCFPNQSHKAISKKLNWQCKIYFHQVKAESINYQNYKILLKLNEGWKQCQNANKYPLTLSNAFAFISFVVFHEYVIIHQCDLLTSTQMKNTALTMLCLMISYGQHACKLYLIFHQTIYLFLLYNCLLQRVVS